MSNGSSWRPPRLCLCWAVANLRDRPSPFLLSCPHCSSQGCSFSLLKNNLCICGFSSSELPLSFTQGFTCPPSPGPAQAAPLPRSLRAIQALGSSSSSPSFSRWGNRGSERIADLPKHQSLAGDWKYRFPYPAVKYLCNLPS